MVSYHHVQYQKKLMTESWENLVTARQTDVQRDRQRWTREILSLRIQPNCRKIRTRKTPYLGNSYAVTFTQHIPEFSQVSTLPYSTVQILENWWRIAANYEKIVAVLKNSIVIFKVRKNCHEWYVLLNYLNYKTIGKN